MTIYAIKEAASALGMSSGNLYVKFILPKIVVETGWLGRARYWDESGLAAAGMAIAEYRRILAEKRAARYESALQRAQDFAAKYKDGMTLTEIGATENLTRERVRQVMSVIGISSTDGGRHKQAVSNSAAREADKISRRDAHARKLYGCSFKEYCEVTNSATLTRHKSNRLLSLYWHHRTTAQRAGTEWQFTLPKYAAFIGDRANLFKREREGLVLGRKDKTGPFCPENCEVVTLATNSAWTGGFKKAHEQRIKTAVKVKELYDSGMTLAAIAKKMARSRQTVMGLLTKARKNGA